MGKHMMATKAIHLTGDVSRDKPDLAYIRQETDTHYIGQWEAGFGFINVKFPKDTTRELTDEERAYYGSQVVDLNGLRYPLKLEDGPIERVEG
jgi:hypothetical protein